MSDFRLRQLGPLERTRAALARRRLAHFARYAWGTLEPGVALEWNWHIPYVCDHVQAVLDDWKRRQREPDFVQRCQNAIFNIPPGTAKSRLVSVFAPAWMWIDWPAWRVLCLSANPEVALRDADFSRQLIESEWYQSWFKPPWTLREEQDAKSNFGNTAGGSRLSKGWGAKVVGVRGDAILADDPNDLKEVRSDTLRSKVNHDWDNAIANRVNDLRSSVRIGIMQRAHEDDWSGHVLRKGGWEHVSLPMEYEEKPACKCASCARGTTFIGARDPRTKAGEVLHPARFTPAVLEGERIRLGSYGYAGQMQQRPAPDGGGMFPAAHWRFWKPDGLAPGDYPRPDGCWKGPAVPRPAKMDIEIISLDAAFKDLDTSDNTAFLVVGAWKEHRYVLDRRKAKMGITKTEEALRELHARWPGARKKLIEDKANGTAVIQRMQAEIPGLIAVNPQGGKEARAAAVQPIVESGNVFLPEGAPWLEDFIAEFSAFPNGQHDDQVDAFSQALTYLQTPIEVIRARWLAS